MLPLPNVDICCWNKLKDSEPCAISDSSPPRSVVLPPVVLIISFIVFLSNFIDWNPPVTSPICDFDAPAAVR